jgi:hypothetical protein
VTNEVKETHSPWRRAGHGWIGRVFPYMSRCEYVCVSNVCRIRVSGCRVLATAAAEGCVGTAVVTGWAPAIRQSGSEQNEEAHFTLQQKSGAVYVPLQQASLTCGATPVQLDTDLPRCRTLCSEDVSAGGVQQALLAAGLPEIETGSMALDSGLAHTASGDCQPVQPVQVLSRRQQPLQHVAISSNSAPASVAGTIVSRRSSIHPEAQLAVEKLVAEIAAALSDGGCSSCDEQIDRVRALHFVATFEISW